MQEPEEAIREVDFTIKHLYKPREPAKLMGCLAWKNSALFNQQKLACRCMLLPGHCQAHADVSMNFQTVAERKDARMCMRSGPDPCVPCGPGRQERARHQEAGTQRREKDPPLN